MPHASIMGLTLIFATSGFGGSHGSCSPDGQDAPALDSVPELDDNDVSANAL